MSGDLIDIFTVPVPDTHVWAIVFGWLGAYVGGRMIVRGR